MDKVKTGELIKEARTQKGYTQQELGDLLGVSNKAVSRWEKGESFPDVGLLESIAASLDLKIDDLVLGEKTDTESPALADALRIARIQNAQGRKDRLLALLLLVAFAALAIVFVLVFISRRAVPWYNKHNLVMLAALLAGTVFVTVKRRDEAPDRHKFSLSLSIVNICTAVFSFAIMILAYLMIVRKSILVEMQPEKAGPTMLFLLGIAAFINLMVTGFWLNRFFAARQFYGYNLMLSTASFFLSVVLGRYLCVLSTLDEYLRNVLILTALVAGLLIIALIVTKLLLVVQGKKESIAI